MKAAFEVGYEVYRPAIEGGRYDLILDTGEALLRVRCKWAPLHGNVIVVRLYSNRRTPAGLLRRPYLRGEIDTVGAYCPALNKCYLIPFESIDCIQQFSLRVAPARNNQRHGIHDAKLYEFGGTIERDGPIAQLGERLDGIQKVAGSSPAGSISGAPC
jgi:PD-(D/E)XK endonuclease